MAKTKASTKHIEDITKPANAPELIDLKLTGDQVIIGLGGTLDEGKEYKVSANVAEVLIKKGLATLKQ